MIQIIDQAPKKPKFLDQLMGGVQQAGQKLPGLLGNMAENQSLSKQFGQDFSGINDPDLKKEMVKQLISGKQATPDMSGTINALNTLESLVGKEGIGLVGRANFNEKARYNRGQFESTQAAILPLFKSMFPRGMTEKEFKFIQEHYIPQASDSEAKIRGKIQGLKNLVAQQGGGQGMGAMNEAPKERPPLSSFQR